MELEFTRQGDVRDAYSFVVTAASANRCGLGAMPFSILDDVAGGEDAGLDFGEISQRVG